MKITTGGTFEVPQPGACGSDGHCLTCGRVGDTAGCPSCRVPKITFKTYHPGDPEFEGFANTPTTTYIQLPADYQPLPLGCVHARPAGVPCPHCLGL